MRWSGGFDRSEIHRPMLLHSWTPGCTYVSLQWGNRYSDPVWRLEVEFELPGRIHRWLDRRYERRWARDHPAPPSSTPRAVR